MNSLIEKWMADKIPMVNGIHVVDGFFFEIKPVDIPRRLPLALKGEKSSWLQRFDEMMWVDCIPIASSLCVETGFVAIVGECSMGGDGFIALQKSVGRDSLLWVAFFDFSNPFEYVETRKDMIFAKNNLDEFWVVDINKPWNIMVVGPEAGAPTIQTFLTPHNSEFPDPG